MGWKGEGSFGRRYCISISVLGERVSGYVGRFFAQLLVEGVEVYLK